MSDNWKTQNYLRGAMLGLVVGIVAAHLYSRAAQETGNGGNGNAPAALSSTDIVKVGLSILSLVRQITELGVPKK